MPAAHGKACKTPPKHDKRSAYAALAIGVAMYVFNFEEKKMKNILLATTAIALTAGYAAADVS
ncbi:MAG: hypothetical protein ACPID0_13475, partial [Paracoccaceae bacterium]